MPREQHFGPDRNAGAWATLNDFSESEVLIIIGQNPGTNSPRMLAALQKAKRNGARIISINPLFETGLNHFRNPQDFLNPVKAAGTLHIRSTSWEDIEQSSGLTRAQLLEAANLLAPSRKSSPAGRWA